MPQIKRVIRGIKGFWIGFILIPFISLLIGIETIWEWIWESRIRNKK